MLCKECGSTVVQMENPRERRCEVCCETIMYSTVPSPTLCEKCSREFHVCESCMKPLAQDGFPFSDEFAESSKGMTAAEARAYGFNGAVRICLKIIAPGLYIHERDPQNPEDKFAFLNEVEDSLDFQRSMAEEAIIDETAKIFGIKRWNSSDRLYSMKEKRASATMTDVIIRLQELVSKKEDVRRNVALIESGNWNILQLLIKTLVECIGMDQHEASELAYSKLHPDDKDLPLDELAEKFTEVIKEQLQKK